MEPDVLSTSGRNYWLPLHGRTMDQAEYYRGQRHSRLADFVCFGMVNAML